MMRTIFTWQREAHDLAVSKGFYDGEDFSDPSFILSRLMLVVTEVAEAAEAIRTTGVYETWNREGDGKPEGFAVELADIVLRVLDMADSLGLDLEAHMERKHEFNSTRPRKNGKKV